MSAHGFICVGGPLDGQWRPQNNREQSFNVANPPPDIGLFSVENAAAEVDLVWTYSAYRLQEHDVHGAAWVFQG